MQVEHYIRRVLICEVVMEFVYEYYSTRWVAGNQNIGGGWQLVVTLLAKLE